LLCQCGKSAVDVIDGYEKVKAKPTLLAKSLSKHGKIGTKERLAKFSSKDKKEM